MSNQTQIVDTVDPERQQQKVSSASSEEKFDPNEWIFPKKISRPAFLGLPASALTIIVVELFERLCYYGCSILFIQYLTDLLGFANDDAAAINQGFSFWSYFTAIIGAYLADAKWGKFKVIAIFGGVYLCGMALLLVSSCPFAFGDFPNDPQFAKFGFLVGIVLVGLGTGAIKSNVGPMCAEQMVKATDEDVERVFRYFYWAINCGSVLGMGVTPYLTQFYEIEGQEGADGASYYYVYGYCCAGFLLGYIIFFIGSPKYVHRKPTGSVLSTAFNIIKSAIRNRNSSNDNVEHWVFRADEKYPRKQVEDIRQLLNILPIFAVFPIYWLLYNQMTNSFIQQASWMDKPSWLSNASLQLIDPLALIFLIPIHDKFVFPFIRSFGFKLGYITRMTIGFVIISTCFFYAFVLQYLIVQQGRLTDDGDFVGEGEYEGRSSSTYVVWLQAPAYFGIAVSEIWTSISLLEFAFSQAPKSMKSLVMATNNLTTAGGSLLGIAMKPLFVPSNVIYLFPILGGVQVALAPFFFLCFRNYKELSAKDTMAGDINDDTLSETEFVSAAVYGETTSDKKL